MTVSDLLKSSLRLLQVTNPTAEELNDAMQALNLMLQEWATSPMGVYAVTRESFTVSSGDGSYTIGSGQDFNTTRPVRIVEAFIRQGTTDYPVRVLSAEDYAVLALKSTQARPYDLYFEPGVTTGTILLYPVPDQTYSLHLYSHKPLAAYTSISSPVNLPLEYEPAIKFNLSIDLAPEMGRDVSPEVAARAVETQKSLKRLHSQPVKRLNTAVFGTSGREYDITGDTYYRG